MAQFLRSFTEPHRGEALRLPSNELWEELHAKIKLDEALVNARAKTRLVDPDLR